MNSFSIFFRNFTIAFVVLVSGSVHAQDMFNEPDPGKDEVIVESKQDITKPYKERRRTWGGLFSANYEKYYPSHQFSVIQNKDYSEISGGDGIPVFGAELGLKYNFAAGSISVLGGFARGTYQNLPQQLQQSSVTIAKLDLNFALDNVFSEPYFVPYVQGGIHQINWEEDSYSSASATVTTAETLKTRPNFHYKVGALIQLNWIENWIDPNTSIEGRRASGLENAYLDVFYNGYSAFAAPADSADGDADLSSGGFGAGLKLEF